MPPKRAYVTRLETSARLVKLLSVFSNSVNVAKEVQHFSAHLTSPCRGVGLVSGFFLGFTPCCLVASVEICLESSESAYAKAMVHFLSLV